MGIEIKNYGLAIRYTGETKDFHYIPYHYTHESGRTTAIKPGDIKVEIARIMNDILTPAYTEAKADLDQTSWVGTSARHNGIHTEVGVKDWEKSLRLTMEYLTKKL